MPPRHRRQRHVDRVCRRARAQADPAPARAGGTVLTDLDASELWYAGYGSNLDPDRFGCYLVGGCPPGATRTYPGSRAAVPALDVRPFTMPGRLVFAWRSPTWGGAIAFHDPGGDGEVLSTAYLLPRATFSDVVEQEMWREPIVDHDLAEVIGAGRQVLGPGRYETLHLTGELDGRPVVTFSAADPSALEPGEPAAAYLATMARGLRKSHGLTEAEITAYLQQWT